MATLSKGVPEILTKGSTFVEAVKACIDLQLNPNATASDRQAAYAALAGTASSIAEDFSKGSFKGAAQVGGAGAAFAGLTRARAQHRKEVPSIR